ncbi:hypothetical protein LZ198_18420 [Myxococcus sp. K15C18031901]|uniref:ClpX C4-type zinc finger protein n=1 Tax=Myxococcus dinghuensis TaxID=2906761 RepID=UPI0020A7D0C6|nr:ClpX C4-type zinc finger protein [Myxococcus dinghuensis]MCP3100849.1 hypothetical protein [Myxococcus dinghuensis]
MAENPRELIRAAQTAELQGDLPRAVEYLQKAAALYQRAGNAPRALQVLRHARRLDGSRVDLLEEIHRLEWLPETLLARGDAEEDEDSQLVQSLSDEEIPLPELARRQRLIDDALRAVEAREVGVAPPSRATWVLEGEVAEDLQRLEAQLARVAAMVEVAVDAHVPGVVGAVSPSAPERVSTTHGDGTPPASGVDGSVAEPSPGEVAGPSEVLANQGLPEDGGVFLAEALLDARATPTEWRPEVRTEDAPPRRRREPRIIERGPTRADVSLDAWCSFCCRPQGETGALVAGPAGAFICKACLAESASLLGDVTAVPLAPRMGVELGREAGLDFVGQPEAVAALEQGLRSGVRCLLVVGPEGCGKSTLFQQLQRQGLGVLATVASLTELASTAPVLVEDVERVGPEALRRLEDFLARETRAAVVLGARGQVREQGGVTLRGDSGRWRVPTTEGLARAVQGALPVGLLGRVAQLVSLAIPTQAEYMEMARARLALRDPAVILSEDALAALAAEASRSPRGGHELHALLDRIPAGTWGLEPEPKKSAAPRKGRRKGTP